MERDGDREKDKPTNTDKKRENKWKLDPLVDISGHSSRTSGAATQFRPKFTLFRREGQVYVIVTLSSPDTDFAKE